MAQGLQTLSSGLQSQPSQGSLPPASSQLPSIKLEGLAGASTPLSAPYQREHAWPLIVVLCCLGLAVLGICTFWRAWAPPPSCLPSVRMCLPFLRDLVHHELCTS